MRCIERGADAAADDRGDNHLNNSIEADKCADKQECAAERLFLTEFLIESLHIFGFAEEQDERSHEEGCVEKCRAEACDEARRFSADLICERLMQQADQQAVQRTRNKPLYECEEWIDVEQNRAHAARYTDADALQKAQQAEYGSHGEAAYRSECDRRNRDRDDVERDRERPDRNGADRRE